LTVPERDGANAGGFTPPERARRREPLRHGASADVRQRGRGGLRPPRDNDGERRVLDLD